MRISDWSSDVCSSDLIQLPGGEGFQRRFGRIAHDAEHAERKPERAGLLRRRMIGGLAAAHGRAGRGFPALGLELVKHAGGLGLGTILGARPAGSKTPEDGAIVVFVSPEFLETDPALGDPPAPPPSDTATAG